MRILLCVGLLITSLIVAQENTKTTLLSSRECSIANDIIHSIDQAGPGWYIGLDSPFISDQKIVDALCRAMEEGITVTVNTRYDVSRYNLIEQLKTAGVQVSLNNRLHTKRVIIADMVPTAKLALITKAIVYTGSDNMTNLSAYHAEIMTKTEHDIDLFFTHYADHIQIADALNLIGNRSPVVITPKKRIANGSLKKNMIESLALRLQQDPESSDLKKIKTVYQMAELNLIKERGQSVVNRYEFTSMSFDSERIVQQIEKLMENSEENKKPLIRFFLSQGVLKNKKTKHQLDRLIRVGALIFIYNAYEQNQVYGYTILQHGKAFARRLVNADGSESYLYMPLTGNITEHADLHEINAFEMHPNNKELVEKQFALNDQLLGSSIYYWGSDE